MKSIDRLTVKYHNRVVGMLSLTPDDKFCAFEYDKSWLVDGFSISPLELPLRQGLFIAKPQPFYGNFGIFEDSMPDGYGRYLLHKALMREGINDSNLSSLDRLSLVGSGGMGALTSHPDTHIQLNNDGSITYGGDSMQFNNNYLTIKVMGDYFGRGFIINYTENTEPGTKGFDDELQSNKLRLNLRFDLPGATKYYYVDFRTVCQGNTMTTDIQGNTYEVNKPSP